MNSVNVDLAAKYVKAIADNIRCLGCDKLTNLRVRYPCGHSVCKNCVVTAEDCLLCLSPPEVSKHVTDGPLSHRVVHTSNLLQTFQDLFKLDVYRRQRISEKLKLEKQLFPECIQAHSKYHNSRRSSDISIKQKENMKHKLPGENTSSSNNLKMQNTISYVQQWLNKSGVSLRESKSNLPRKPFTDLFLNGQNISIPKIPNKVRKRNKVPIKSDTHLKPLHTDIKDKTKLSLKRKNTQDTLSEDFINLKQIKCEKHESGIIIDDDIVDLVNDSQSNDCYDKDREAWLAVLEAEKNKPCDIINSKLYKNQYEQSTNTKETINCHCKLYRVPFYKKSSLINTLFQNNESINDNKIVEKKNKNVTITIDNSSYVTTINLIRLENNLKESTKHSVEVQTEDEMKFESNCQCLAKTFKSKLAENENIIFKDNFDMTAVKNQVKQNSIYDLKEIVQVKANKSDPNQIGRPSKCLVIDESDTDSDLSIEKDSLLEVTAEIHRSEIKNDHNVLCQLEPEEYEYRKKHTLRGNTPASSDSSDKENYDPNRAKKQKFAKKCYTKK